MATREPSLLRRVRRRFERLFELISARPLSILVFAASVVLLVWLEGSSVGRFEARAVGRASVVEHPALVASFVQEVFVKPGDRIEAGAPLVDLSDYFVERELERIEAEISQLLHEAALARARVVVEEELWLDQSLRRRPQQPSLSTPTEELFGAQLGVLQTRRTRLREDLGHLTVRSQTTGRISLVVPEGSSVAIGTSVATIMPEHAEEIVAFVPSATEPARIAPGTTVLLASPRTLSCTGVGLVLRRGARVEQAPEQAA